ncbi:sigma-70 family RNA polymerase sigma factor [Streptomyces sp. H27-D2]|uniref:sigma-70 family RNA polymerase sigma factor n=1 Tax=Streptomyces sp. H27-D2 TaxID=3046304 RepID=UPI002DBD03D2|nr:sigma-70 family RNA polymerase sigma factor [Streptomyces sp. H27-D2]MEC4017069.1 sigma-70 family RNA polymerase sigma factor [Streptomyces sp. H27-D2]
MTPHDLLSTLRPLLAAEAAAEAHGAGIEAADLEQDVWLRLLERTREAGPPAEPVRWLRSAVRTEVRSARRRARREVPYDPTAGDPAGGPERGGPDSCVEHAVLGAERDRALRDAVRRLPGRCPGLLMALLSRRDPTYREIAGELGISQGSLGPVRSRCLGCLRRMLTAEVAAPEPRGKER